MGDGRREKGKREGTKDKKEKSYELKGRRVSYFFQ